MEKSLERWWSNFLVTKVTAHNKIYFNKKYELDNYIIDNNIIHQCYLIIYYSIGTILTNTNISIYFQFVLALILIYLVLE